MTEIVCSQFEYNDKKNLFIVIHRRLPAQDILVTPENTYAKILGNSQNDKDANEANVDPNKSVYSTA